MKDHDKIKEITKSLLEEIGEDPTREGLIKTPERVAKAWDFFSRGYDVDVREIVNDAIFEEECSEVVVVRDIEFFSLCEHHMIPFFGRCHVGYLPNKKIIGLSKIPRIVDAFAQRLQIRNVSPPRLLKRLWISLILMVWE